VQKTDHTYGPETSELNLLLAGAAYVSGILNEKLQEFSAEAGLGCPTHRSLERLREKVQDATEVVSNQLMSGARKRHNSACHNQPGYKGDLQWQEEETGRAQKVAQGPIGTDGGGAT
jgi:hypothetical protein